MIKPTKEVHKFWVIKSFPTFLSLKPMTFNATTSRHLS